MTTYDVIFKEMIKNPDDFGDLKFFLELRNEFDNFYNDICVEFYNNILGLGLEKSIKHYNQANTGRSLALRRLKRKDDCLKKSRSSELRITSSYWPAPYILSLGNIENMNVQFVVDDEQTAMPREISGRMITDFGKLAYATNFGQKEVGAWFYYGRPYRNLKEQEAILPVIADVAFKGNQGYSPTFAARYINDMMELVGFVDQIVEQADDRSKLIAPKGSVD